MQSIKKPQSINIYKIRAKYNPSFCIGTKEAESKEEIIYIAADGEHAARHKAQLLYRHQWSIVPQLRAWLAPNTAHAISAAQRSAALLGETLTVHKLVKLDRYYRETLKGRQGEAVAVSAHTDSLLDQLAADLSAAGL